MSVYIAHNIDDLAREVVEVKEHVRKIHQIIDTIHASRDIYENQLRISNDQLGVISRAVTSFEASIVKSDSPPNYSEIE